MHPYAHVKTEVHTSVRTANSVQQAERMFMTAYELATDMLFVACTGKQSKDEQRTHTLRLYTQKGYVCSLYVSKVSRQKRPWLGKRDLKMSNVHTYSHPHAKGIGLFSVRQQSKSSVKCVSLRVFQHTKHTVCCQPTWCSSPVCLCERARCWSFILHYIYSYVYIIYIYIYIYIYIPVHTHTRYTNIYSYTHTHTHTCI